LVEQPIRNRQVSGSSPLVGSILVPILYSVYRSRQGNRSRIKSSDGARQFVMRSGPKRLGGFSSDGIDT